MSTMEARARTTDPATSHQAAESISAAALAGSKHAVMEFLSSNSPVIAETIEDCYKGIYSPSRIRTAIKDLLDEGAVCSFGVGRTKTGRKARLYMPTGAAPKKQEKQRPETFEEWLMRGRKEHLCHECQDTSPVLFDVEYDLPSDNREGTERVKKTHLCPRCLLAISTYGTMIGSARVK